jgi:hypothetical protein
MSAYAASAPIEIVAHTNAVHAVRHTPSGRLGIVFWQAGTADVVTADKPCIVYYEVTSQTTTVAVSDPTHATSTLTFRISQILTPLNLPPGVATLTGAGGTSMTVAAAEGKNYVALFSAPHPTAAKAPWPLFE